MDTQLILQLRMASLELATKLNPQTADDLLASAQKIHTFLTGVVNEQ